MSDWLTIRVVLEGTPGNPLAEPPGRIMMAHADHTFAELAEAIDLSLGRWDLSHLHEFTVDGRSLVAGGADDIGSDDSDDVTLGEVGLRVGERFTYVFDLGEGWQHACTVDDLDVDPAEEYGEEPDAPVPLFGWGSVPDQYWRTTESDDDEGADADSEDYNGQEAWAAVQRALGGTAPFDVDPEALRPVAAALRAHEGDRGWPYGVLLAAAALDADELPADDELLWVEVASGIVNPAEDLPIQPSEEHAWTAIDPTDWAALVIELFRAEHEPMPDAQTMLQMIARCPEVEEQELTPDEEHTLLRGLDLVRRLLESLGALDAEGRLTPLGRWGLPQALERGLLA